MNVYAINPLKDERWIEFLEGNSAASVFHTPEWLRALERTYGYEPVALTTSAPGEKLRNGIVFCRVKSWLTGCRMVSLPFSDHCQPLVENEQDFAALAAYVETRAAKEKWKYIELRPLAAPTSDIVRASTFAKTEEFCFHALDLRPDAKTLFRNLHKSCIQRKINRAEGEHLHNEEGRSESLLAKFYNLLLLTRRRHRLPPQPRAWFENLAEIMGDRLKVRVASKAGQPVASILTLAYKRTLVYKYGCSDARYHNLGGMPFLFWKAIQDAKESGAETFDLGRSDADNEGLISFKNHLGAECSKLSYYRFPHMLPEHAASNWKGRLAREAFSRLPSSLVTVAGRVIYRHVG